MPNLLKHTHLPKNTYPRISVTGVLFIGLTTIASLSLILLAKTSILLKTSAAQKYIQTQQLTPAKYLASSTLQGQSTQNVQDTQKTQNAQYTQDTPFLQTQAVYKHIEIKSSNNNINSIQNAQAANNTQFVTNDTQTDQNSDTNNMHNNAIYTFPIIYLKVPAQISTSQINTTNPNSNINTNHTTMFKTVNISNYRKILIPQHVLYDCTTIKTQKNTPVYAINTTCLKTALENLLSTQFAYKTLKAKNNQIVKIRKQDYNFDIPQLVQNIALILNSQKDSLILTQKMLNIVENSNNTVFTIQVPLLWNTPNTNGTFAKVYLEADHSRQLLFLWNNGKYETFLMSGTYDGYTPFGIHQIYYKSPKAWSKYSKVWMPYWMAFATDPYTGGRIGLHGLVYYCPGRVEQYCNSYIYEPESNLGTPKSKGCLRVSVENAKYIYNKIKLDTYIIVHE